MKQRKIQVLILSWTSPISALPLQSATGSSAGLQEPGEKPLPWRNWQAVSHCISAQECFKCLTLRVSFDFRAGNQAAGAALLKRLA